MPYATMRPDGTQDSYYYTSTGQSKYSGRTPGTGETGYDLFG